MFDTELNVLYGEGGWKSMTVPDGHLTTVAATMAGRFGIGDGWGQRGILLDLVDPNRSPKANPALWTISRRTVRLGNRLSHLPKSSTYWVRFCTDENPHDLIKQVAHIIGAIELATFINPDADQSLLEPIIELVLPSHPESVQNAQQIFAILDQREAQIRQQLAEIQQTRQATLSLLNQSYQSAQNVIAMARMGLPIKLSSMNPDHS